MPEMNAPQAPAYLYRARVVSVYDGDSATLDIDLGFGVWMTGQKVRFYGIDTPELRGSEREQGLIVRDIVREKLPVGSEIVVETIRDKSGKFGRWLVILGVEGMETSLNQWLLDEGHAEQYLPR